MITRIEEDISEELILLEFFLNEIQKILMKIGLCEVSLTKINEFISVNKNNKMILNNTEVEILKNMFPPMLNSDNKEVQLLNEKIQNSYNKFKSGEGTFSRKHSKKKK